MVDTALFSPDDSMDRVTGDYEQLEHPHRPMTPGEEEILRIYEDGVYRPPDMFEIPGGFQLQRFCGRPGRPVKEAAEPDDPEFGDAAHCREANHRSVMGSASSKTRVT